MKFNIRYTAQAFAAIAGLALSACALTPTASQPHTPSTQEYVVQSVLVVFVPNSNYQATIADIEAQHTGVRFKKMLMNVNATIIGEFGVPKGKEKHVVRRIAQHPQVQAAERNAIVRIAH